MKGGCLTRVDHENGVVEIRLNRAPVNALSAEFLMEFADLVDNLSGDDAVSSLVLTSDFKVLSAGLDLKEAQGFDLKDQHAIVKGLNVGFVTLFACPKPVVVAINGAAIAGGLFFVLASDVRLASPRAKLGLAEVRVGATFPVGPMEIARATLAPDALRYLMLRGSPVSADRAYELGLVDEIVAADTLRSRALEVATEMATLPAATYAAIKQQIRGEVVGKLRSAMKAGANSPEGGWFNEETVPAMQRMISS